MRFSFLGSLGLLTVAGGGALSSLAHAADPDNTTLPVPYACPASTDDAPVLLQDKFVRLAKSSAGKLCTLARVSTDKPGIMPAGRTYDGYDWENVAGAYVGALAFECTSDACDVDLPSLEGGQSFVLTTYDRTLKRPIGDQVARFLEQSTFGPTVNEINDSRWNNVTNERDLKEAFALWVSEQQVDTDATSHREWWRKRTNPRQTESFKYGKPGSHPCEANSRWRTFAFSVKDAGKTVGLLQSALGPYVMIVDGHVRTIVENRPVLFDTNDVETTYELDVGVDYEICSLPGELVGGTLSLRLGGSCLPALDGNPAVHVDFDVINATDTLVDDDVVVVDMSSLTVGEDEELQPVNDDTYSSALFDRVYGNPEHGSGDEFLLTTPLEDSLCSSGAVPDPWEDTTSPQPVFALLPSGEYSMHDRRLILTTNTIEQPLPDGGGTLTYETDGAALCSNVPRSFLNEDSCKLSYDNLACGAPTTPEISFLLNHETLRTLYNVTGRYVYAIDGLDVAQAYAVGDVDSPCNPGTTSRWISLETSTCGGNTTNTFSNDTVAAIAGLLASSSGDSNNVLMKDIIFPEAGEWCDLDDVDDVVGAEILTNDGTCWKNVHPDHLNVYDFTFWAELHPGGPQEITKFAEEQGLSTLTFPYYKPEHVISRWHANRNLFEPAHRIGRLGDDAPYADLPEALLRNEVAAAFANSGAGVVVCGSPGEVANDPTLGDGFDINNRIKDTTGVGDFLEQRKTVWTMQALQAPDQLRQRVAWALSQILVITPGLLSDQRTTETKLAFYDIFTRHACGNYLDVLREVAFSPLMGQMLTYDNSRSLSYQLKRYGILSYPDENFAREVLQLFSVGLIKLNLDGTPVLDGDGETIQVYDNDDILSFARAWTGFGFQSQRGNIEDKYDSNISWMDPMRIDRSWRDPYPKMDVNRGYIGDRYPLCAELPPQHFLRIGARYRLLGSTLLPELQHDEESWVDGEWSWAGNVYDIKRVILQTGSALLEELCNSVSPGSGECNFPSNVVLDSNLPCNGLECNVDSFRVVQVAPDVFYEYIRPPCVELPFFNDGKKVRYFNGNNGGYNSPMCADPRRDVASETCCDYVDNPSITEISRNCEYTGERTTYGRAEERCEAIGKTTCNHGRISLSWCSAQGYGSCCAHHQNYFWTSDECAVQVKVHPDGKVALVHNPGEDDVSYKVSRDTRNYFRVNWENDLYPTVEDGCGGGACEVYQGGCLCNTVVSEDAVFSALPSPEAALSQLHIGSSHPGSFNDTLSAYRRSDQLSSDDVQLFYREVEFDAGSVFQVERHGVNYYLQNKKSTVRILLSGENANATQFAFRNPPHFMSLVDPEVRDAYHETEAVLEHYMYHDNTAPFLATRLLQRFGKSNPSPRYVEAVASAFQSGSYQYESVNFGAGRYGDLASTVAAILLDREATSVVLDADPSYGSLREPLLKVIGFMRSMQYTHDAPLINPILTGLQGQIGQMAYDVQTVFSFFLPEYLPPGPLSRAALVSPEAGVLTTDKIISLLNGMFSLTKYGLTHCYGGFGTHMGRVGCGLVANNYENSIGHLSYSPQANATAEDVVDELATLLTAGRLSGENRGIIRDAYLSAGYEEALAVAQQLIVTTAEFHSTNVVSRANKSRDPVSQPSSPGDDYKAIVFVMLQGGMDSYNMLVPHSDCNNRDLYEEYRQVRGAIALDKTQGEILEVDASRTPQPCDTFGLHYELEALRDLYSDGDLVLLADVGLLMEPVTKENWQEKTKAQLFAHNHMQREAYKVDVANEKGETGVLGRMLDVLRPKGYKTGAVSIDSSSLALTGDQDDSPKVTVVANRGVDTFYYPNTDVSDVIESLNNATTDNSGMFGETWSSGLHQSLAENAFYKDVLSNNEVNPLSGFGNSHLEKQLEMVSRLIKGHVDRGTDRDVFYVQMGGFDAHSGLKENLETNLGVINDAMKAFASEMKSQGNWDDVTLVAASDFGRTLTSNDDGTDHAWSGNYFMLGGQVDGGKLMGRYPDDLTEDGAQNIGRGRLFPKTPWDAIWHGVGQWFGVTDESDVDYVLPNRAKFGVCTLFTDEDLYVNGQHGNGCTYNPTSTPTHAVPSSVPSFTPSPTTTPPTPSPSMCEIILNGDVEDGFNHWVSYGATTMERVPGAEGSANALSSSGRAHWGHGVSQFLRQECLSVGELLVVTAKFKLLDENNTAFNCDISADLETELSCVGFHVLARSMATGVMESTYLVNDVGDAWNKDEYNYFHAYLTVTQNMVDLEFSRLVTVGPRPGVTILVDDLIISRTTQMPTMSPSLSPTVSPTSRSPTVGPTYYPTSTPTTEPTFTLAPVSSPPTPAPTSCQAVQNGDVEDGTSHWSGYASTLTTVSPGAGGTGSALSSYNRGDWGHGTFQSLDQSCLTEGDVWIVTARFKLLDENDDAFHCDVNAALRQTESCPQIRMLARTVSTGELYATNYYNELSDPWNKDEWNYYRSHMIVTADMVDLDFARMILDGPMAGVTILVDDLELVKTTQMPTPSPTTPAPTVTPCSELIVNGDAQDGSTTGWSGYASTLSTASPGADGSGWAFSSTNRNHWGHGIFTYLDKSCMVTGQQWHVSAKFKLLDENNDPYYCEPTASIGNSASCPIFRVLSRTMDAKNLIYAAWVQNDSTADWVADGYNEFQAVMTVVKPMVDYLWTRLILIGPQAGVTILMDDMSITPLATAP